MSSLAASVCLCGTEVPDPQDSDPPPAKPSAVDFPHSRVQLSWFLKLQPRKSFLHLNFHILQVKAGSSWGPHWSGAMLREDQDFHSFPNASM